MKMISLIWFMSLLAFLVADVRTGASRDKEKEPVLCYTCARVDNTTDCQSNNQSQVKCTPELPYCATLSKSPDYTSALACSAGIQAPCILKQTAKDTYEMTCTCDGILCNKPFTREFRNELLNFSPTNLAENTTGLFEMFINSSVFANITSASLYEAITISAAREITHIPPVSPLPISSSTVFGKVFNKANAPRAEALKHEPTLPSDDDEDEGEGSGSFEDAKPHSPAAPAAPSSFLPENENSASFVHINLFATIFFISLFTVA